MPRRRSNRRALNCPARIPARVSSSVGSNVPASREVSECRSASTTRAMNAANASHGSPSSARETSSM
jgi:hypothetical protein